jgi:hypothetical protein
MSKGHLDIWEVVICLGVNEEGVNENPAVYRVENLEHALVFIHEMKSALPIGTMATIYNDGQVANFDRTEEGWVMRNFGVDLQVMRACFRYRRTIRSSTNDGAGIFR